MNLLSRSIEFTDQDKKLLSDIAKAQKSTMDNEGKASSRDNESKREFTPLVHIRNDVLKKTFLN